MRLPASFLARNLANPYLGRKPKARVVTFSNMQIEVSFQPKPQLMFSCMEIGVKLGFMAVSLSIVPSRRLVAKSNFCCST